MLTINSENAKQIRTPFEVYSTFSTKETGNDLTFSIASGSQVSAQDTNLSTTLDDETIPMRILTDLSGDGFTMDGTAEFYDPTLSGSEDNGKVGLQTAVNGTVTVNVTGTKNINALTIAIVKGTGTVTADGQTYEARRIVVVPVNAKTKNLTFTATNGTRLSIASITAGITLEFNSDNIISCTLALRSNLDIVEPNWSVSDIELQAYYPDDISSAISNVGDDVPITYYSGYEGDYSPVRTFYLSEKANIQNNVVTLKGEDISHKLEATELGASVVSWKRKNAMKNLYNTFYNTIKTALGGKFPITKESAPATKGSSETLHRAVIREQNARDLVSSIMNVAHGTYDGVDFYPVFVDAGIPTVRWSKPTAKWDIHEEDCADVVVEYDRNINRIVSSDGDYAIESDVTLASNSTIDAKNVDKGKIYTTNFDGYVYSPTVSNASEVIYSDASRITWKAKAKTTSKKVKTTKTVNGKKKTTTKTVKINQSVVKGKAVKVAKVGKSVTSSRAGISTSVNPNVLGRLYFSNANTLLFPNWKHLFDISNEGGSFTFKGDPRMQPRDVFRFHRLDGTVQTCTIETITLVHADGGTSADITYRKGIV